MGTARAAGALGVVAVALLLLSGTGTSLAGWNDSTSVGRATTVASGALSTTPVQDEVLVHRGGSALPASTPLLPGDVVEITTSVRLAVRGVAGELALDAAGAAQAFSAEGITLGAPSTTVAGLPPGPATVDGVTWRGRVTGADDGRVVTATVRLPLGTGQSAAAQGRRVDLAARPATWSLTQDGAHAGWRDGESVAPGALATDTVALAVARTGAGTASVANTSGAASVAWSPTALTAAPAARTTVAEAGAVLSGLTIGYGTDCAATDRWRLQAGSGPTRSVTGAPAPLAAGAGSALCLAAAPADADALVRAHGARSVTLSTTVTATADVAPEWTATGQATATYQVPFPRPAGLACASGSYLLNLERPAVLTWSWAGSATLQPAVARWEVVTQHRDGTWHPLDKTVSGTLRAEIYRGDLVSAGWVQRFKLRAYPFTADGRVDRSVYVESDTVLQLHYDILLGFASCRGSVANDDPAATPILGGLS